MENLWSSTVKLIGKLSILSSVALNMIERNTDIIWYQLSWRSTGHACFDCHWKELGGIWAYTKRNKEYFQICSVEIAHREAQKCWKSLLLFKKRRNGNIEIKPIFWLLVTFRTSSATIWNNAGKRWWRRRTRYRSFQRKVVMIFPIFMAKIRWFWLF